jgi:S-formylglutathione hydrolase FrmB
MSEPHLQIHSVESPFQDGLAQICVLTPDALAPERAYPVVYVLPVEPGSGAHFGDGLAEIHKHGLQNRLQFIAVAPTFSYWPWCADHPSNPSMRQESHFLRIVIPFVEANFPAAANPDGRLLLGFSKSGFAAFSLLLRRPETFGRAAAWDGAFGLDTPDLPGVREVFGTQENFDRYRPAVLLERCFPSLQSDCRLALHGYADFREDHELLHRRMAALGVPHDYRDGPQREHRWDSGWVPEAIEWLIHSSNNA